MKGLLKLLFPLYVLVMSALTLAQIPETQHSEGISYITGGVGEGEAVSLLAEAKQWPLLLELSQVEHGKGVWIFGAKIKVVNIMKQVIFDAQADGPYMLINLESGDYAIEASYEGAIQRRSISIKRDAPQKVSIFWR